MLIGDTVSKKQILPIGQKLLRILTGGRRPVDYLHNTAKELKSRLPATNPDSSRVEDLNQAPLDFISSSLTHLATWPFLKQVINDN